MEKRKTTSKDEKFAKNLKRYRKRAGLTQEDLADKTRLSVTFIGLLETAQRKPSLKTLQKIASAVGAKAKDLLPF